MTEHPKTTRSLPPHPEHKIKPGKLIALHQALDIQKLVYETIKANGLKPNDMAQLARAWDILEDRKRILRGKPLPGSLKPAIIKATRSKRVQVQALDCAIEQESDVKESLLGLGPSGRGGAGEPGNPEGTINDSPLSPPPPPTS